MQGLQSGSTRNREGLFKVWERPSTTLIFLMIMHSEGSWSYNSLLSSYTYSSMSGSGPAIRHGKSDEDWETVYEFRGINLLNEQALHITCYSGLYWSSAMADDLK
jgi:hypothetical protein